MFNYKQKICDGCLFYAHREFRELIGIEGVMGDIVFCIISSSLHDGMFEKASKDKICSCDKLRRELLKKMRKDIVRRIRKQKQGKETES